MFRCEIRVISRAGRSGRRKAMAAVLAYRTKQQLVDPNGKAYDYSGKGHVGGAITHGFVDPQTFCDAVEEAEKRKDSQLGREAILSIDRRLDGAAARRVLIAWAAQNLDPHGLPWTAAAHNPQAIDGERNPHIHIVWSDRPVEGNGLGKKRRLSNPERAEQLAVMRRSWADLQNDELARAGHDPDLSPDRQEGPAEPKMGAALGEVRRKGSRARPEALERIQSVREIRKARKRQRRLQSRQAAPQKPSPPDKPLVAAQRADTPAQDVPRAHPSIAASLGPDGPANGDRLRPLLGESAGPRSRDLRDPARRGTQRKPLRTAIAAYKSAKTRSEKSKCLERVLVLAMQRYRRLKNAAQTVLRALGATKQGQVIEKIAKTPPERKRGQAR